MKPIVLRVYPAAFSFEIHQTPPPFLSMKREDCPTLTRIGLVHVSSTDTNGQQTCQQLAAPGEVRGWSPAWNEACDLAACVRCHRETPRKRSKRTRWALSLRPVQAVAPPRAV